MRAAVAMLATAGCAALAACGSSAHAFGDPTGAAPRLKPSPAAPVAPAAAQPAAACQATAASELEAIGRRIYAQAVSGRNVVSAVTRLTHSRALLAAVAADDPRAARAALAPLLKHQVVRVELFGSRRRLATYGTSPAFSPVRAELRAPGGGHIGHLLLAVTGDRAYLGITHRLTGADVVFSRGARTVMTSLPAAPKRLPAGGALQINGARYRPATIHTQAFPAGRLSITLLVPAQPPSVCGTDAADTRLRTVGAVGRRLFTAEQSSAAVQRVLRHVAHDAGFRRAAASENQTALRAAVVGFFRTHSLHVVRVRLTKGARLVYDLGGPHVLAPASADVRAPDGRPAGRFTLSVQDDTGYIKLMHRFTGAAVQLRTPAGLVPGSTLAPGPTAIPDHGTVAYAGRRYLADSFTATAFPTGPLRISLLLPTHAGSGP